MENLFEKSALAYHAYDKHLETLSDELLNYNFGVIKQVNPRNLDREEDYYITMTKADNKGLNRYKVLK